MKIRSFRISGSSFASGSAPRPAFPFARRRNIEQLCDGDGDVLDRHTVKHLSGFESLAIEYHRNRHILRHIRAVTAAMSAVIGADDQRIILRQIFVHLFDAVPRLAQAAHVFLAHPAVGVAAHLIRLAEVDEGKVGQLRLDVINGGCSDLRIGIGLFVLVIAKIGMKMIGAAEVAQLFPCVEERALPAARVKMVEHARHGTHLRDVGIGYDAVTVGIHTVEERHVAGQGDRRLHRLGAQRVGRFFKQLYGEGMAAFHHAVGPHAVHQHQYDFVHLNTSEY